MQDFGFTIIDWAIVVGVVLGAIGLLVLLGGLARLLRGRVFSGGLRTLAGALLCTLVALGASIGMNLYAYNRLGAEQTVADIRFQALGTDHFLVFLSPAHGDIRMIQLDGDEWQLDAQVIKWSALARLAGFDTLYRLERISGRYHDIAAERSQPHTVVALSKARGMDAWRLTARLSKVMPGFDARYGSATYLPMVDGAAYRISLSATGLVARPTNEAALQALATW